MCVPLSLTGTDIKEKSYLSRKAKRGGGDEEKVPEVETDSGRGRKRTLTWLPLFSLITHLHYQKQKTQQGSHLDFVLCSPNQPTFKTK